MLEDGLKPTPDAVYVPDFDGLTADEIYPLLASDDADESSDGGDTGNPPPAPGEGAPEPAYAELERLATQWRQRLAAAAQQALQAGKLSPELARVVDFFLQPRLPWRSLLAQHLSATARNDYSYTRPSSRRGDPAVFPGLRGEQIDLVVAVDTSGSIRDAEIGEFFAEIDALKGQIRARIALLCCDAEIGAGYPRYFEAWDDFSLEVEVSGGGGTDFRPVFDWIERQDMRPGALVYFTDAEGRFPDHEPPYPTVWLVKGGQSVPFGARIQLND